MSVQTKQPKPEKLFAAIKKKSLPSVQEYLKQGGSVDVFSNDDRSPLSIVALALLESKGDDWSHVMIFNIPSNEPTEMSEKEKKLCAIGCALIEAGAKYTARSARTNRSITIDKLIKNRLPEVDKEWSACHQKVLIMGTVQENIEAKPSIKRVRKI